MSNKAINRFKYLKRLINNDDDYKELIDCFYYNSKAINYVNKLFTDNYMMNNYYTLQPIDILLITDDANSLKEVKENLLKEYQEYYALSVWDNYLYNLSKEVL